MVDWTRPGVLVAILAIALAAALVGMQLLFGQPPNLWPGTILVVMGLVMLGIVWRVERQRHKEEVRRKWNRQRGDTIIGGLIRQGERIKNNPGRRLGYDCVAVIRVATGYLDLTTEDAYGKAVDDWCKVIGSKLENPPFKSGTSDEVLIKEGDFLDTSLGALHELRENIDRWLIDP